ncbi:hypothetical protein KX75_20100 [Salmonella enterica subsp. enterica]|nr:hypothetical protein [Salmonella enterica subsp. enterica serovar Mikawasima]
MEIVIAASRSKPHNHFRIFSLALIHDSGVVTFLPSLEDKNLRNESGPALPFHKAKDRATDQLILLN